ncbi:MAG TPA: aminotransferase class IV [Candidatus Omnitrophota bacterium]|nr:aminotransferase class IV [Candidatus Omnitrophota bacterium]
MTKKKTPGSLSGKDLSLIETLLWENGGFFLIGRHMARLEKSAEYFSFTADPASVIKDLNIAAEGFCPEKKYRVRLLLGASGSVSITSSEITCDPIQPVRVRFSEKRTQSSDVFLSHKTTRRDLYDSELSLCRKEGFFETLFMNTEGEVTEGAITNIIIEKGGAFFTPPLSSGVLPGTYREYLLSSKEIPLKERVLYLDDVMSAEKVFVVNSVIKTVEAAF